MSYVDDLMGKNERIVFRTRQHWTALAQSCLLNLILVLIIAVVAVILIPVFPPLGFAVLSAWLFPIGLATRDYLKWWAEEYLVTNRRIVQAEGVINKHVIDSSLEKVNDVVLSQSILGRLFDYGDIEILTASEMGVNRLHRIASPVRFKTEMLNQKEALGMNERVGSAAVDQFGPDDVPELIAELDQLRQRGILTDEEFQQKKAQLLSRM